MSSNVISSNFNFISLAPVAALWRFVGAVTEALEVPEDFFGTMFLTVGSLARHPEPRA